ncbi:hypothetical protein NST66_28900 [Priestia sp. FSL W8-0524]|uniref:hypothetical protein n=1 Tax=Priestia sp. FSL W8-0524 TaxID=2954625 RepID=UPI0030FB7E8F
MNESQREVIVAVAETVAVAWERMREALISLAKTISEYRTKHIEAEQKVRLLRQSWIIKLDTRRLSQVMDNKPKVHKPRILY